MTLTSGGTEVAQRQKDAESATVRVEISILVKEIVSRGIDITAGYKHWLQIGFALCDELGEEGRSYFHDLSRMYPEYNYEECDKQYTDCMRSQGSGIHIATLFQKAKEAGIDIGAIAREALQSAEASAKTVSSSGETPASPIAADCGETLPPLLLRKIEDSIVDMDAHYEENEFLFKINGVPCISKADVHTIGAKQKAGKTSFISILMAAAISGRWNSVTCDNTNIKVLYIDTEMKKGDTQMLGNKATYMAEAEHLPDNFTLVNLRSLVREEMKTAVHYLVKKSKPQLVIIDGIVDLCANFNDPEESQKLVIDFLMKIAEENQCAIINVLHTNKSDGYSNLRGHLGAYLVQKGVTEIRCDKDEYNIVKVSFPTHRYAQIPELYFTFDENGIPVDAYEEQARHEQDRVQARKQKKEAAKQQTFDERA